MKLDQCMKMAFKEKSYIEIRYNQSLPYSKISDTFIEYLNHYCKKQKREFDQLLNIDPKVELLVNIADTKENYSKLMNSMYPPSVLKIYYETWFDKGMKSIKRALKDFALPNSPLDHLIVGIHGNESLSCPSVETALPKFVFIINNFTIVFKHNDIIEELKD